MPKVCVIGFGIMGQDFARECCKLNFEISVFIREAAAREDAKKRFNYAFPDSIEDAAKGADLIVLAVPFSAFPEIISKLKSAVTPNSIVVDLCSIKKEPMKLMESLPCETVGLHQLFGKVESFSGQKIVICPRNKRQEKSGAFLFVKEMLEKMGAQVIIINAKEHDQILGKIQGLTHLIGLNVWDFIEENNEPELRKFATPTFQYLLDLVDKMRTNNKQVFLNIQKENPYAVKTRKLFIKQLREFSKKFD